MNTFVPTTADALRAALASTISCSAQELQEAAGQIVVATTGEVPQASVAGREARSLHDPATRTTVLLADHIPAGQEAQVLAQEIERHHGRQVAQAVLGDRAEELLGRDGMRLKYAAGEWNHLFGVGGKETRCRIVIDLEQPRLIAAQEWTGLKFEDVRGDRLRDLAESVIEVNEAHANLDDWKFERTSELPSWTGRREMTKNRFETEQEASDYKLKHQLYNRVAEPIGGGKWGLVYPIKSHIQVNDGAPAGMRQHHGEMHGNVGSAAVVERFKTRELSGESLATAARIAERSTGAISVDAIMQRDAISIINTAKGWAAVDGVQSAQTGYEGQNFDPAYMIDVDYCVFGATPDEAVLRNLCLRKLGEYVELPIEQPVLAGSVPVPIEQSQQTAEKLVRAVSDADLLAEINRRGMLQPLYGAIGAMHDHLDRTGALGERLSQYLAYRLRREEAAITGMPDSALRVANWQECIDELDRESLDKSQDSPSPGM